MRTKERPQNVGDVYSSGREELPAREAGLVYPPESGCAPLSLLAASVLLGAKS